jgi:hypothetical protein
MPRMTKPWRNAAVVLAVLGFISVARYAGGPGNPGAVITEALLNAAIWFGVVYLVFLIARFIRR